MTQNIKYHAEIRKWNTEQLINVLELNGLSDCSEAIRHLEIDGEAFLNLSEGQLAFWRQYLNNVQVKRFWSIIQLARERPQNFIGDVGDTLKPMPHQEIERIRSPIAQSLENLLGQKPGIMPGNNTKQEPLTDYENQDTFMQIHGKPPYNKLPPKPAFAISQQQQQQQSKQLPQQPQNLRKTPAEEYLPMKPTEMERKNYNRDPLQIPNQHEQMLQNPEMNVTKHEQPKPNSFLHSNVRVTNFVTSPNPSNTTTNKYQRVPSPSTFSRPLPVPPKEENAFPLPPNIVPLLPDWKTEAEDEDYDEVDHYKMKPWYSDVNRKQANDLLIGKPNGTFIARPSKNENYECSLSIVYNYRIYNLAIAKRNNKLVIGNNEFDSVNEIIEFFMDNEMILNGDNNEDIVVTLRQI